MATPNNREYRAWCPDCGTLSPRWTTSFIAHVEAAGHRDRTDHDASVETAGRSPARPHGSKEQSGV